MKFSQLYDHKVFGKWLLFAVLMILSYHFTGGIAALVVPILVIFSLARGRPIDVLFWVFYMTLSSAGNRFVFSTNGITVLTARATLILLAFIVASKIFGRQGALLTRPFLGILFYIAWECVVSFQGFEPVVSYLKLILFVFIYFALYGVVAEVNASSRVNARQLRSMVLVIVAILIVGSVLLIPFPGISLMADADTLERMRAGEVVSLFCGMCAHSQAMGPVVGIFGTFVFADLVFSIKKWDPLYVIMFLCCPILCYKTSSRTGMGTFLAGITMVIFIFMQSKGIGQRWRGKVLSLVMVTVIVGLLSVLVLPSMRAKISGFALKWGGEEKNSQVTVEGVLSTRQEKIDIALYNFRKKPITGNGFQVSEEMQYEHRKGILAYLSAPIEKGVWVTAILEEGGAVGLLLFVGWLVFLFPTLIKRRAYVMGCTFFAMLVSNLGEFTIFSLTYIGGILWTLVFAAGALDVQRLKDQGRQNMIFGGPLPPPPPRRMLDAPPRGY